MAVSILRTVDSVLSIDVPFRVPFAWRGAGEGNRPAEVGGGRRGAAEGRESGCEMLKLLLRMNGIGRPLPREVPTRSNDFAGKEVKGKNRRGLYPCARFRGRVAAFP